MGTGCSSCNEMEKDGKEYWKGREGGHCHSVEPNPHILIEPISFSSTNTTNTMFGHYNE